MNTLSMKVIMYINIFFLGYLTYTSKSEKGQSKKTKTKQKKHANFSENLGRHDRSCFVNADWMWFTNRKDYDHQQGEDVSITAQ